MKKTAVVTTKSYRDHLLKQLQDKAEAVAYLNAPLQDEDPRVFLMALHDVADANGGLKNAASQGSTKKFSEINTSRHLLSAPRAFQ